MTPPTPSTPPTTPPPGASPGHFVRWALEVLNTRDVTPLRPFWRSTTERFPDRTCKGAEEIAGYFEEIFAALPDFAIRPEAIVEQGADVFVRWRLTGTHSGDPFQGIQATGREVEIDGMDHFVIRDGAIASNFVVFDQLQFARQIGLMPSNDSILDRGLKQVFNVKTQLVDRLRRR